MRRRMLHAAIRAVTACAALMASTCPGQTSSGWSSRELPLTLEPHRSTPPVVTGIAIDPKGLLMAAAGDDHLVRVWNRQTGELVWLLEGHTDWVRALAFSPDGAVLASAGNDRRIVIWNALDGTRQREIGPFPGVLAAVRFSHDGELLATTGYENSLALLNWRDGTHLRDLPGPCQDMRAIAFSSNDKFVAAGGRSGKIRVWSVETGEVVDEYAPHRQRVRAIEFERDSKRVYSTGEDRSVFVAEVGAGAQGKILTSLNAKIQSLASWDNWVIAGCTDNSIRIIDSQSGKELANLAGHAGTVSALAVLGGQIFSGSFDTTVREWKISTEIAVPR